MEKVKAIVHSEGFILSILLFIIGGLFYLPWIYKFGYFYDDWYLMFAAGAKGPTVFREIFSIDRPLRALVMIPLYQFFGPNPLYYNLSAFAFRLLSGLCFMWTLRMVWPRQRWAVLSASLLFLTYPGFLSQPNAIDYQSHLSGLAAGMLSIALSIKAIQFETSKGKALLFIFSILLGWFYLSQIEWYIGLEFFRFACIFILVYRERKPLLEWVVGFARDSSAVIVIPTVFLIWRIFFFQSERGATDLNLQFGSVLSSPMTFLLYWLRTLGNDNLDVLFLAWIVPLQLLDESITKAEWAAGLGIVVAVLVASWIAFKYSQKHSDVEEDHKLIWKREMFWLGVGMILFGLLPVILVGRTVDFKSYSRYTIIASAGAAFLWAAGLSLIYNMRLRNLLLCMLIFSASWIHYANGLAYARNTQAVRDFWWQVGWRIPQMELGTTLIAHYAVVAEEDYFTWGPANLIYYPESLHERYVQPSIYAALLSEETVDKVLAKEAQDFSNRRSIRTYPNYRNILILTQPSPASCVQVIDLNQLELSSFEDSRIVAMAPFSETEHVLTGEAFHTPPAIPFGSEPAYEWCYYYEKASYARQLGDWAEVARLGEEAHTRGFFAGDQIEWMPFLQAYAYFDNISRLKEIAPLIAKDPAVARQACQILTSMPLTPSTTDKVNKLFCLK